MLSSFKTVKYLRCFCGYQVEEQINSLELHVKPTELRNLTFKSVVLSMSPGKAP